MTITLKVERALGEDVASPTHHLRWLSRIALVNGGKEIGRERVLQQAHRISVVDDFHRVVGSRIEWRDVPTIDGFDVEEEARP